MCFQISAMNQNNGTIEFHYYECACQIKHILQKSRAGWFKVCKKENFARFCLKLVRNSPKWVAKCCFCMSHIVFGIPKQICIMSNMISDNTQPYRLTMIMMLPCAVKGTVLVFINFYSVCVQTCFLRSSFVFLIGSTFEKENLQ